jgi:hypothetical protein
MNSTGSTGSDNPNAMTRNRSPVELIQNVAESLEPKHRRILALAYDTGVALSDVDTVADELGGTPYGMLQARYQLKRALKDTQDVPFAVVPDEADMDRVPISLYEAQRLASITEIADLEKWLLSDIDLCKDIAEFSAFVHALRGGALQQWAEIPAAAAGVADAPKPQPAETPQPVADPTPKTAPLVTPDSDLPPVDTEPVSADIQDERDAEEESTTPTPKPVEAPKPGGAMKAILITGATIAGAVVLLVMIMIYALRAG